MLSRETGRSRRQSHHRKPSSFPLARTSLVVAAALSIALVSAYVTLAAISLSTSVPYTQNFDGLGIPPSNPAPSNLPIDFRFDTLSVPRLVGSYSSASNQTQRVGGANVPTNAANGGYNFGAGTTTVGNGDRAVGFISSGTATASGNLYAELQNNTGATLSGIQLSYDVEKYRNGLNPAGFRIQLYYSSDGQLWTSAGPDFLTAFTPDANNNGFASAPGAVVSVVNQPLSVSVTNGSSLYLSWNYSVSSGNTTTNAQALAIDNISILGVAPVAPTDPTGIGSADPSSVAITESTLLTVNVTPGANPTSTAHSVTADLTSIGGTASQQLFDDGNNGDIQAGDNTFSFLATVANGTTAGNKVLPFTITETALQSRVGTGNIPLAVVGSIGPAGAGAANPNSLFPGEVTTLTVSVTPGLNPPSNGLTVVADLSAIGGNSAQLFFDDGTNGDAAPGNNVFTFVTTVSSETSPGSKSLPFTVTDSLNRSSIGVIGLTIQQPQPPVDHVVISQLYGGGGNSNATYTHDYVELFNPTGVSFNLAGWSLQYASATGTNWSNKQPLGGNIAPGEYFLVALAGGANGVPLPVTPNIDGDINMSATTGKLALVKNAVALNGACPNGSDPDIVDFVGYGTANCFEGAERAPAPSNSIAIFRKLNGAQDTNQNSVDFMTGTPGPRRTAPVVELGPWVAGSDPIADSNSAPYDATITIDFSEPVDVAGNWFDITCNSSGQHNSATLASYNNFKGYQITPNVAFQFGEQCSVTVFHGQVHDQDTDDSAPATDTLFADHSFTFTVVAAGAPAPYSPNVHLTLGNPSNAATDPLQPNNYLMEKPTFALSYNRDKGTPNWVSWHLDSDWFGNLARVDTFRADPAVSPDWYRVQSTDYFATGFDRGHMTPNADRDNQNRIPINQETYLMSNMVPQSPDNNQGPWAEMENDLRAFLNGAENEIYVVSGPLGVGGSGANGGVTNTIANGHVTVPAFTWKVALILPKGENDPALVSAATRTIAVIMPNIQGIRSTPWQQYLTTVDAVENLTGYDFFSNLPNAVENAVEAGTNGNNPPGTEDETASTSEDTPASISLDAVSPQANPNFTYTIVSAPAHGTVSGTGPSVIYTPAPNYNGFDSFTFKVNDGNSDSNTATVRLTVDAVNDGPSANSQAVSTNGNTPSVIVLSGSDLETAAANLNFIVTINPLHGSLSGSGANLTYTPAANYSGPDSFQFTVTDTGDGAAPALTSAAATVSITVDDTINPSITAPVNLNLGTGVGATSCGRLISDTALGTANASDNSGMVSIQRSGVPAGNIFPAGTTTVTYIATDGAGNTAQAFQTITVFDNTQPTLTAPAPTTASANSNNQAPIPNVVPGATANDNCGSVAVTQSPAAGTLVGIGTHTITLTATDAAGNARNATTTFTVSGVGGGLTFSLTVSPTTVRRGRFITLTTSYNNQTGAKQKVTFRIRYNSPCGNATIGNIGPITIKARAHGSASIPFYIPGNACTGVYRLTLESYINGALNGSTTASLTVTP